MATATCLVTAATTPMTTAPAGGAAAPAATATATATVICLRLLRPGKTASGVAVASVRWLLLVPLHLVSKSTRIERIARSASASRESETSATETVRIFL